MTSFLIGLGVRTEVTIVTSVSRRLEMIRKLEDQREKICINIKEVVSLLGKIFAKVLQYFINQ